MAYLSIWHVDEHPSEYTNLNGYLNHMNKFQKQKVESLFTRVSAAVQRHLLSESECAFSFSDSLSCSAMHFLICACLHQRAHAPLTQHTAVVHWNQLIGKVF